MKFNSRIKFGGGLFTVAALALAIWAPQSSTAGEPIVVGPPSADFTRYVSIGDSIAAGFASGGLAQTQQAYSYPALLAQAAGSPVFEQPLISEPGIPNQLALLALGPVLTIAPKSGSGAPLNLSYPAPYNNLAVPGAKVSDTLNTVSDGGLHDVILRGNGTALQQTLGQLPTFVTVWIGNNDVLGAATGGIVIDENTPTFGFAEPTLTSVASFQADYRDLMQALAATGAGIAVADIPNVTDIAYVNAISPVGLQGTTGANVVRALTAADRVLLPASAAIAGGQGTTGPPLPNSLVLDEAEIAQILARTAALNQVIHTEANAVGAAIVPANAIFQIVASEGISIGGANFNAAFLRGGIFTYDGVHPSSTGHGLVANFFIEAINARFGSSIPLVDLAPLAFGTAGSPNNDPGMMDGLAEGAEVIYSVQARDQMLEAWNLSSVFDMTQAVSGIGAVPVISERYGIEADQGRRGGKRER